MAVDEIRLGPFVGGLNSFSDPTAIGDTEVARLINFELDIDGSLVSRPPIEPIGEAVPGADTYGIDVLGFYESSAGAKYLIASNRNNATYYFDGAAWYLVTNTFAATAIAQYRDELWLVAPPTSANPSGRWSPLGGFTAVANMPKGGCIVAFKDRLWIAPGANATANGSRLYLSNIVAGAVDWPSVPNYLQIGAGDGQNIVDLAIYYQSIIIFKSTSTYRFSFSGDPSLGDISRISDNIGAIAKGCFATYKNELYVLFDNKVYEFSSYNYDQLNSKVPLKATNPSASLAEQASISVWSDRIFVQYYDTTYVYSFQTRTWSIWSSTSIDFMGRFWSIPGMQGNEPTAYTYRTAKTGYLGLYVCKDVVGSAKETMTCTVVTKNYDYLSSARYKRLISWGADLMSKVQITAKATPVTYTTQVTWDQLRDGAGGNGGFLFKRKRVNRETVPRASTSMWAASVGGGGGTYSFETTGGPAEANVNEWRKFAFNTAAPTSTAVGFNANALIPVIEGETVTASIYGICSEQVYQRALIIWLDASNAQVATTPGDYVTQPAGVWGRRSVVAEVPTGLGIVNMRVQVTFSQTVGTLTTSSYIGATAAQIEDGSETLPFFDGQTVDYLLSGNNGTWLGAANGSQSWINYYVYQSFGYTWDSRKNQGYTWDRPLDFSVQMVDAVSTVDKGSGRKFIKFLKSLRFRQISFELSATTDGDSLTAPVRIFNIMTRVSDKQYAPRKIN